MIKNINVITIYKNKFLILDSNGNFNKYNQQEAQNFALNTDEQILMCHRGNVLKKIGLDLNYKKAIDILELWAFVKPAEFVVPTVNEIAKSIDIEIKKPDELPIALMKSAEKLLIAIQEEKGRPYLEKMIANMSKTGWGWGDLLMEQLDIKKENFYSNDISDGFDIWNRLKKWENRPPPPPAGNEPINEDEILKRLKSLLPNSQEQRLEQFKYSKSLINSFNPNETDEPTITIAEGGTGVGKTIGYLAPATVWAEKNDAPIWISTYTRNLQHQIYNEVKRLYKNEKELYDKVVICKGRENYICTTKFKLAIKKAKTESGWHIALGILARWLEKSIDGDITGNDFPSWLREIIDPQNRIINMLVVKRDVGETHSHCEYSDNCFVDLSLKRSAYADIVITNHAFLLFNAKFGFVGENHISHIVFDEGHHLFEASDSAFGSFLCATEAEFMRRFIIKNESGDFLNGGGNGLKSIITDIFGSDPNAQKQIDTILDSAQCLPDSHWQERLDVKNPSNIGEKFFADLAEFILNNTDKSPYDVELDNSYVPQNIIDSAYEFANTLKQMIHPISTLIKMADDKLSIHYAELDREERRKLTNALKTMQHRIYETLIVWVDMLYRLDSSYENEKNDYSNITDTFILTKSNGMDNDVGVKRHYINPIKEFAEIIYPNIQGAVITSASLLDSTNDNDKNWDWANIRTGTDLLKNPVNQIVVKSPFDYKKNSRVIVVNDINKNDINQLSSAYYQLLKTNNGSALGLFTSIARLKKVHEKIYNQLSNDDITLYAQHIDNMNTATLVNVFKYDFNSCLLGTNAVRDGVDIPGDSLNMLVLERIPWDIPDIMHKTRKKHFKNDYEKSLVRAKLKQAFGRLIRQHNDVGTFVILDSLPSDLKTAFPDDVDIITCGINEAIELIK